MFIAILLILAGIAASFLGMYFLKKENSLEKFIIAATTIIIGFGAIEIGLFLLAIKHAHLIVWRPIVVVSFFIS